MHAKRVVCQPEVDARIDVRRPADEGEDRDKGVGGSVARGTRKGGDLSCLFKGS